MNTRDITLTPRFARLSDAIRRTLPMIEPRGIRFASCIRAALVAEIVNRIDPGFVGDTLAAFRKGGK